MVVSTPLLVGLFYGSTVLLAAWGAIATTAPSWIARLEKSPLVHGLLIAASILVAVLCIGSGIALQNRYDADQQHLSSTIANQGNKITAQGRLIERLQREADAHGSASTRQHNQIEAAIQSNNHPVVNVTNVVPTPRTAPVPSPSRMLFATAQPSPQPSVYLGLPKVTATTAPVNGIPMTKLTITYPIGSSADASVRICSKQNAYTMTGTAPSAASDVTSVWKLPCSSPAIPIPASANLQTNTSITIPTVEFDLIQKGQLSEYLAILVQFSVGRWHTSKGRCNWFNDPNTVNICAGVEYYE